jgi:hypothetical protein
MWVIFRKYKSFYYFLFSCAENCEVKKWRKYVKKERMIGDKKEERKRTERASKMRKNKE